MTGLVLYGKKLSKTNGRFKNVVVKIYTGVYVAESGDKITLDFEGNGLRLLTEVVYVTLDTQILEYLGTTKDRLKEGKDKIILQYDFSEKHKWAFLGIGVKQ